MIPLRVNASLALGALASADVINGALFTNNFDNEIFAISGDLQASLEGLTAGEGPIEIGISNDYTAAETEEALEATSEFTRDPIQQERARRQVRSIGTFNGLSTEETLNDGKPMRKRFKFVVGDGYNMKMWAYNRSGATLTTGATVRLSGMIYAKPL